METDLKLINLVDYWNSGNCQWYSRTLTDSLEVFALSSTVCSLPLKGTVNNSTLPCGSCDGDEFQPLTLEYSLEWVVKQHFPLFYHQADFHLVSWCVTHPEDQVQCIRGLIWKWCNLLQSLVYLSCDTWNLICVGSVSKYSWLSVLKGSCTRR